MILFLATFCTTSSVLARAVCLHEDHNSKDNGIKSLTAFPDEGSIKSAQYPWLFSKSQISVADSINYAHNIYVTK